MNENTCDKACRRHAFIVVLGMTVLVLLMMMSIVGAAPYAYVTNSGDDTVSVIDTATDKVTATVDVGKDPYGVAVSPDGKKIYVSNWGSGTISVIDAIKNKVAFIVSVGDAPYGVAVTLDGSKVYVANQGSNTVSIIDTATNNVISNVSVGFNPIGVAVTPDGSKVYVTHVAGGVFVIDTATNIATRVKVPSYNLYGVTVSPDGTKVYVTSAEKKTVYVIDTATNKIITTVRVGSLSFGVSVTPNGKKIYVTNAADNNISVIDTATNNVTAAVNVGNHPYGVAVSPYGKKVYVANSGNYSVPGNTVSIINTTTNAVIATVPVGDHPHGVAVGNNQERTVVEGIELAQINTSLQKGPVFLEFGAEYCGACTKMKPILKDLAIEYAGKATVISVDALKSPELGDYFGVEWVPDSSVMTGIENGEYIYMQQKGKNTTDRSQARIIGLRDKKVFEDILNLSLSIKPPSSMFTWKYADPQTKRTVLFTDNSAGSPTSWYWEFGDGATSDLQNPAHTYKQINKEYEVTLRVENEAGSDTATDRVPVGPVPP